MTPTTLFIIALLGCAGGFFSGLLGFGGGVVMFPLLYYVPPLIGLAPIDAKTVAAIVITQVFFSTMVAGAAHFRSGRVHWRLAFTAGISSAVGAFLSGAASPRVTDHFLLVLFAVVTLLTSALMGLPPPTEAQENLSVDQVVFPPNALIFVSLLTGVVIGFLGAGNFVFVPLLIYLVKIPTRIAIASSLFIATMNTLFGFIGKIVAGQLFLGPAASVVAGAVVGAYLGEQLHGHVSPRTLRRIYAAMVIVIAVRLLITVTQSLR
ncbi:MAG: sulfite exporter TauE/SafE family protein [Deltaproteobacteria bacterium]|nr:sulfite exporter TauE/SafE family protein [Deltaproteobacteria bacterium]MDZ4345928.1 sulfite exporter TauE/SafE family protein [Candidatus Binatia bacterium]